MYWGNAAVLIEMCVMSFVEAGVDAYVETEYPEGCKWDYGEIYLITTAYCIWKFHEASENDATYAQKNESELVKGLYSRLSTTEELRVIDWLIDWLMTIHLTLEYLEALGLCFFGLWVDVPIFAFSRRWIVISMVWQCFAQATCNWVPGHITLAGLTRGVYDKVDDRLVRMMTLAS